MENEVLQDILDYAVRKLNEAYGYCGVASGTTNALITGDDKKGNDISIHIRTIDNGEYT